MLIVGNYLLTAGLVASLTVACTVAIVAAGVVALREELRTRCCGGCS